MEQCGTMEIINHSTGHRAHLTFKPAGSNSRDLHHVEGYIADKSYDLYNKNYTYDFFVIFYLQQTQAALCVRKMDRVLKML